MSTLLRNISTSESNLYLRELMLSCAIINLLVFFDLMFSIFVEGSRFNSCVNVDEVLWSNKNDSSLSRLVSFKTMVLEGLLTLLWFSLWDQIDEIKSMRSTRSNRWDRRDQIDEITYAKCEGTLNAYMCVQRGMWDVWKIGHNIHMY